MANPDHPSCHVAYFTISNYKPDNFHHSGDQHISLNHQQEHPEYV